VPVLGRPIRVVIVDDQPLQRAGYRMVLESQADIEVVGEAGDGAQALGIVRRVETDVVLMDIQMPRVNGLDAAARVATDAQVQELVGRPPRVVLLTAVDLDDYLPAAASAGVFAVLFKDTEPELLLGTVRDAAASDGQG
jgi:DNA-binding NarL/FixJ family response regulator